MDAGVLASVSLTFASAAVALCVVVLLSMPAASGETSDALTKTPGRPLPLPSSGKEKAPWYLDYSRFDSTSFSGGAMTVTYQANKYGGGSGASFRARPFKMYPSDAGGMGCSIFVPADFDFVKSGKLGPGLCIGTDIGKCATGGNYMENAGSARVSFTDKGEAVAYVYVPEQTDSKHGDTGDHLLTSAPLRKGAWNEVGIGVSLGAPGATGSVELYVNGKTYSKPVKWRTSASVKISGVLFATFFGGSDGSYAPKKTQKMSYKNFWVR